MEKLEKVVTHLGTFYTFPGDLITRQLRQFGAHQRNELSMFLSVVRDGDVVLDIGANIGTFSIPIARKVGSSGRTCSFEADDEIFAVLQRNIEKNGLCQNILVFNAIVTQNPGSFRRLQTVGNAGATRFERDELSNSDVSHALSIDEWYESSPICGRPVNVIKIDVEGMDADVLFSCRKIVERYRPVIYVEISRKQLRKNGYTSGQIDAFLKEHGYVLFRNVGVRNSDNDSFTMAKLHSVAAGGGFFDLLALPSNSNRCPTNAKGQGHVLIRRLRDIPSIILGKGKRLFRRATG